MSFYSIHDLDPSEKPRERLFNFGAEVLTDSELLAIILRSGGRSSSAIDLSRKILKEFGGFKGLYDASTEQLLGIKDLGEAKVSSIKSLCEIALRINDTRESKPKYVRKPQDIVNLVKKDLFGQKKENLVLISLDSRNKFLAKDIVSVGTINETLVHPREIFRQAILRGAVSLILVHNHPSGDVSPSDTDVLLTETIQRLGREMGIPLIDHVIIGGNDYMSMKAAGIISMSKGGEKDES